MTNGQLNKLLGQFNQRLHPLSKVRDGDLRAFGTHSMLEFEGYLIKKVE